MSEPSYVAEVEAWRAQMEESLRAEDGWLALAGLFWLSEGENLAGSGDDCDVSLPAGSAPARVGSFVRSGERVVFRPEAGAGALVNGEPATERELASDMGGGARPDIVTAGSVTMFVIKRGERYGIRARDAASPQRQAFAGRIWFPVQPEYRVTARFTPFSEPRTIQIPNILGDVEDQQSPGTVSFTLGGRELTLTPTGAGGKLFFVIKDTTSGHDTYGIGRFLYVDGPAEDGSVTLDFNRAYNPPCAFTPYATCPMAPRENYLPVAVEAGERFAGH